MLPDVWRMADRRARAYTPADAPGPPLGAVSDGVSHHLAVDGWFHRSAAFIRGESLTRGVLRRVPSAPKLPLFAHVTWELCLDGALLRRVGTDALLAAVRGSVGALRPDLHHRVAGAWVRLPEGDRAAFEVRVDRILAALAAGPWIAGYATSAGVVERLDGVRVRLGLPRMSGAD